MTPRLAALFLAIALLTGLVQPSAHAAPAPWVSAFMMGTPSQADTIRAAVLVHDDRLNEVQMLLDAYIAADLKNPPHETPGSSLSAGTKMEAAAGHKQYRWGTT